MSERTGRVFNTLQNLYKFAVNIYSIRVECTLYISVKDVMFLLVLIFVFSNSGDLLLRIQEFETSLLKSVMASSRKWLNAMPKQDNKTVGELFNTYNYLQKENPLEFGSLIEFIQNVENGWPFFDYNENINH